MNKLLHVIKRATITHILLFSVAVGLPAQRAESQNLNDALNTIHEAFKAPPYTSEDGTPNFNTQLAALMDREFLIAHGIVTTDRTTGKPIADFVMGKKLQGHVEAAKMSFTHTALQKANKDRDEIDLLFSQGRITEALALARKYQADFRNAHVHYYDQAVNRAHPASTVAALSVKLDDLSGRLDALSNDLDDLTVLANHLGDKLDDVSGDCSSNAGVSWEIHELAEQVKALSDHLRYR